MTKRLTRKDIAERAGVSPSTVSRALAGRSDLLPEETITKICRIADELGYTKNMLASRLASNKSFQIGFVVPLNHYRGVFQLSYYSTILDAIVSEAFPRGYTVSIAPVEQMDDIRYNLKRLISGQQVDGVIIGGLKQDDSLPAYLEEKRIPSVLVGSHFDGSYVGSVNCDPSPAIEELMRSLEHRGYKRLYFVGGNMDYYDAQLQVNVLRQAVPRSEISDLVILDGDYSRRSGYAAAEAIVPKSSPDDCVFLANDRMAMGFYRYCSEAGVDIPRTIGVIGSDDDEAATALYPDLTTIHQPRREMGAAALRLLVDRIEGSKTNERTITLEKSLCMRNSLRTQK